MIQFLYPLWLAAGAAILVPVILHFWNDRRGKVLRVGSVALLTGGSRRAAWSRRLTELPLLLVRCLLLAALAVLMAQPRIREGGVAKGWVLAAGPGGPLVDSLVKAGWERHFFQDSINYWEGFREADRAAPAGVSFFLLTPALASRFGGERPVAERPVHWEVYTPSDSVSRWVESAWRVAEDSVRVVEGVSRATGTVFAARVIGGGEVPASVPVDTSAFRVAVYTDEAVRQDGQYVKAAVRALQQYTQRRMEVTEVSGIGGDWLFWLSDQPVRASGYKHIFQYTSGTRRFNVDSGGLVWSEAFPVWLERLFFGSGVGGRDAAGGKDVVSGREAVGGRDMRVLDVQQIVPLRGSALDRGAGAFRGLSGGGGSVFEKNGAELYLLCIVLFLFMLERNLVNGKQTT